MHIYHQRYHTIFSKTNFTLKDRVHMIKVILGNFIKKGYIYLISILRNEGKIMQQQNLRRMHEKINGRYVML